MAVWTEVEGAVSVKTKDKFSIMKAIEGLGYDGSRLNIDFMPNSSSDDLKIYQIN